MSHRYKSVILSHGRGWDHLEKEFGEKRGWTTELGLAEEEEPEMDIKKEQGWGWGKIKSDKDISVRRKSNAEIWLML